MSNLFTDTNEELRELRDTPNQFLNQESDFLNDIAKNEEGRQPDPPKPPADNPNYRDESNEPPRPNNNAGGTTGAAPNQGQNLNLGSVLGSKSVVLFLDNTIPLVLTLAAKYAFDIKIKKSALQMTAPEKASIEPIMQECLKTININFDNPWNALLIAFAGIYGSKAAEIMSNEMDKEPTAKSATGQSASATPFGYDEEGNAKAPYGYNADGTIKKDSRPTRGKAKQK